MGRCPRVHLGLRERAGTLWPPGSRAAGVASPKLTFGLTFLAHRPPHDESHYEEEHEPQEDYRLHCRSPCDALAWSSRFVGVTGDCFPLTSQPAANRGNFKRTSAIGVDRDRIVADRSHIAPSADGARNRKSLAPRRRRRTASRPGVCRRAASGIGRYRVGAASSAAFPAAAH